MSAKTAETDSRGHVILRMEGGEASAVVLEVAVRVARTFHGELRGLFLRNENLLALAGLPFAREISFSGRRSRALSAEILHQDLEAAAETMHRRIDRMARAAQLPFRFEVARGLPAEWRAETGILALGDPLMPAMPADLAQIFNDMSGIAGVLLAGREARRAKGPVLAVIDPKTDAAALTDTARQIAEEAGERLVVAISNATDAESRQIIDAVRQALGTNYGCEFVHAPLIGPAAVARLARRYTPGLVIGPARLIGERSDAARYATVLECPVLLLR